VPVPATGKSATTTAISIFKVSDGKIVSYASEFDQIGLQLQLGWTLTPSGQT
jgi:predicted ester cyclase